MTSHVEDENRRDVLVVAGNAFAAVGEAAVVVTKQEGWIEVFM